MRHYPALHCPLCGELLMDAVVYGSGAGTREAITDRGYEYRCPRTGCRWVERHERRVEVRA